MNTPEIEAQFIGTPWTSDDEIYDFAREKKNIFEYEWEEIQTLLIEEGLQPDYAEAIISNLRTEETRETAVSNKKNKRSTTIYYILWTIVVLFVVRPLSYYISIEYSKWIVLGIAGIGYGYIRETSGEGNKENKSK